MTISANNNKNDTTLRIAGLTPFTTIDYPGYLSAVVYCRGCPFACSYCHNADMQCTSSKPQDPQWSDFINLLEKRKETLEAVVFSGGEPLVQKHLPNAMEQVKDMGFLIGMHSSGSNVNGLKKVIDKISWIGFDVKHLFEKYEEITKVPDSGNKALESLNIIMSSGVDYEIRTTADPDIIPDHELLTLASRLQSMNIKRYRLQLSSFRTHDYAQETINQIESMFSDFEIRHSPLNKKPAIA